MPPFVAAVYFYASNVVHKSPSSSSSMLLIIFSLLCTRPVTTEECDKDIDQYPATIMVKDGEPVSITCTVTTQDKIVDMHLTKEDKQFCHIHKDDLKLIIDDSTFLNRLTFSGNFTAFTLIVKNFGKDDHGLYTCRGLKYTVKNEPICGNGTYIRFSSAADMLQQPPLITFLLISASLLYILI